MIKKLLSWVQPRFIDYGNVHFAETLVKSVSTMKLSDAAPSIT